MSKSAKFPARINKILTSLLIITILAMLSYVSLIPYLGFYSEDFFFAYVGHFYKTEGLIKSLAIDRPFNGYLLAFYYSFFKDNVFIWHIFVFLIRLIGGYCIFLIFLNIWPKKILEATLITLIFLLYPGFLQQTLPLGYSVWITALTLWVASLALNILVISKGAKLKFIFFTIIALILQVSSFLQLEFFIGLESLRVLMITLIIQNNISLQAIRKTFKAFSPYLITLIIFVLWRIFLFKSTRQVTDINWVAQTYYSNPLWIIKIPFELAHSFIQTAVFAYFIPLFINFIRIPLKFSFISISLGIGATLLFNFFYKKFHVDKTSSKEFGKKLFLIGLISVILSLIPIIISGRSIRMYLVYDRYTLTSIIGVSFIILGLVLFKVPLAYRKWLLSSIVFLSITSHLMNGFYRVDYWNKQKDLWWQLYWRAPNIQSNAMLILDFPPPSQDSLFKDIINKFKWYRFYWVEEQIWTAGNLFFNYHKPPREHFYGDFLDNKETAEKIKNGASERFNNRNIIYTRDFKNSIIINVPSDISCLQILDGDRLIRSDSITLPPKQIFGAEPPHSWCYYFQKASLARQQKDWEKLSQLKEEVAAKKLKPKDPIEWLPFENDLR